MVDGNSSMPSSPHLYACPHCAQAVEVAVGTGALLVACGNCGGEFVVAGPDGSTELSVPLAEVPVDHEDELDGLRIRQMVVARRAAYRSRSYCFIGLAICVVGSVQLVLNAVGLLRSGGGRGKAVAYLLVVAAAVMAITWLTGRIIALTREIRQSAVASSPSAPPDFSPLSDGSQQWQNLERLTGEREE